MKKELSIKELQERIDKLEEVIFHLDLIDHWTSNDSELFDKYNEELRQLKELVIKELTK